MIELLVGFGIISGIILSLGFLIMLNEMTGGLLIVLAILTGWGWVIFNLGKLVLGT